MLRQIAGQRVAMRWRIGLLAESGRLADRLAQQQLRLCEPANVLQQAAPAPEQRRGEAAPLRRIRLGVDALLQSLRCIVVGPPGFVKAVQALEHFADLVLHGDDVAVGKLGRVLLFQ